MRSPSQPRVEHVGVGSLVVRLAALLEAGHGAAVVLLMRDEFSTRFGERWELVLGLVFVGFVYFLPRGIGGLLGMGERRLARTAPTPRPPSPLLRAAGAGEGSLT